jgi:hypothetical protein
VTRSTTTPRDETLEQQAQRLVKDWPPLTASQKATLRTLLRPVITGDDR